MSMMWMDELLDGLKLDGLLGLKGSNGFSWWPVQAELSGVNTGASIVHYLHCNLDDDTGCTCSSFSDNTNLEGVVLKPNSGASVERTLKNLKIGSTETS